MKTSPTLALLFLATAALAQTTPPPGPPPAQPTPPAAAATATAAPTLSGISFTSYIGFTPLPLDQGKTPQTSPCANSPYTTDSKIYTVILKVLPQISGAIPSPTPNIWVDAANPQKVYFVSGSAGFSQIKTSRRTYDTAFSNDAAEVVVPDLTWADASDILTELQKSPTAVTGLASTISSSASLSVIPVTLPDNTDVNKLVRALFNRGARLHTKTGWATAIQLLGAADTPLIAGLITAEPSPLTIQTSTPRTTNLKDALQHLQGLVNASGIRAAIVQNPDVAATTQASTSATATLPTGAIFLVDSPCLTVSLLPAVVGSTVTGGDLNFNGHYLFPFAQGHSFAKVNVAGTSPLNRTADGATSTLTATLDAALNHDMLPAGMNAPVRFTGGLTTSFERTSIAGGSHPSKASGGLKGSISFPGFTGTGNDTRPTLTFEAVGSTLNGSSTKDTSQFEGNAKLKAKFRWTSILNSSIDGTYNLSHDAIYGAADHKQKHNYLITVDLLKFTVKDPLEFAATWKCGRAAPDYKRVCGFYTGISLTSNQ
jgi:hypothetical protein